MTDNQNDEFLDTGDLDADSGLEDFETGRTSLAEAWKTNPMVKIGGVLGAVAILVGGIMLFGGEKTPVAGSVIAGQGKTVTQAPGEKVPDVYRDALQQMNERDAEEAQRTGNSTLPVPIGPAKGKALEDKSAATEEDPLERWRRIQEERLKKEQQAKIEPTAAPQKPVDPYAQEKQALAQSMQKQMQSVLEQQTIESMESATITPPDFWEAKRQAAAQAREAEYAAARNQVEKGNVKILLEAGRIEYAQMITEANSDVPGPILAQLASGPLAGSRMIGSFQKQDDYLTLNFTSVVVDGVAISTSAVALDPETSRPGVVTDVDRKYFQRIILPAAAAFVEGMGKAIADSGTTTVTVDGGAAVSDSKELDTEQQLFKGLEEASSKAGKVLDAEGNKAQVMVKVAAGTHIGVFFTKPVEQKDAVAQRLADEQLRQQMQAAQQATPQQFFVQLPQQGQGQMTPTTPQVPAGLAGTGSTGQ
jgi:intracellular multiplication protein IcmE